MVKMLSVLSGGVAGLASFLSGLSLLKETDADLKVLALLGWVVGPYALFALLAWLVRGSAAAGVVVLLGVTASAAFAAWAIHDALKPPREALDGLVFVVVPVYQGAALALCALVAGAMLWRSRRRRSPGS